MECPEAREHLADLNRGQLGADLAEAVRGHAVQCASCRGALETDGAIRSLIRVQAPRYAAPPALRARIEGMIHQPVRGGWGKWWGWLRLHPWPAGALAGAVGILLVVWVGWIWRPGDPVSRMIAQAVTEHAEYTKEVKVRPGADPGTVLRELRTQVDFPF
ncbi:MAG: hypothetical protein ACM362_00065, partial [Candidatus Methylomirabilota bacterium]